MPINKTASDAFKEKVEEYYSRKSRSIRKKHFDIFHFSVKQKLWQSNYYFDKLVDIYDRNKFETDFVERTNIPDDLGEVTQSSTVKSEVNKDKLAKYCNLYLDGYFSSVSSIFDTLLHEANVVFKLVDTERDIYFQTIIDELREVCPGSELYRFLAERKPKRWWKTLGAFRNSLTHESIIATSIVTTTNVEAGTEKLEKIPLPDDPKARPFTYRKERELKHFVENFNKNVLPVLERWYRKMNRDLVSSGKLPIQL